MGGWTGLQQHQYWGFINFLTKKIMDNLYIKIQNNIPQDHPVALDNLIKVFGSIPDNFCKFTRILAPQVTQAQIAEHKGYIFDPDINSYIDFWIVRDQTVEESHSVDIESSEFQDATDQ
jgi:hypothetical protein